MNFSTSFVLRLLYLLPLAASLQAYGSAPSRANEKQAPSRSPASTKPIIEYYGDSTVWGYASGLGTQVAVPAPAAFADVVGSKYEVINEGVSGTDACQLLKGADGKHPSWEEQMAASKASYVIINHGINDQWRVDLPTYKSCLQKLAHVAKKNRKNVIFETPNPVAENGGLVSFVNAMKEVAVAEKIPVIDQYRYLSTLVQGGSVHAICPDGVHPSDSVYVMKGRYAANVFLQTFNSRNRH